MVKPVDLLRTPVLAVLVFRKVAALVGVRATLGTKVEEATPSHVVVSTRWKEVLANVIVASPATVLDPMAAATVVVAPGAYVTPYAVTDPAVTVHVPAAGRS